MAGGIDVSDANMLDMGNLGPLLNVEHCPFLNDGLVLHSQLPENLNQLLHSIISLDYLTSLNFELPIISGKAKHTRWLSVLAVIGGRNECIVVWRGTVRVG